MTLRREEIALRFLVLFYFSDITRKENGNMVILHLVWMAWDEIV